MRKDVESIKGTVETLNGTMTDFIRRAEKTDTEHDQRIRKLEEQAETEPVGRPAVASGKLLSEAGPFECLWQGLKRPFTTAYENMATLVFMIILTALAMWLANLLGDKL